MTVLRDDLFRLLPAVHQRRDADPAQGNVLEALMSVLGRQGDVVAADLDQLYDDWFIETCGEWVVPYIGDLLGVRLLHPVGPGAGRYRALVANTIDYRRRKGTAAVLEQLGDDVTGWPTAAVEYFQRLGTTQYLAHRRPARIQAPDLRRAADLELVGGPFGSEAHTVEVRRVPKGRYGIGTVGLHVWRLEPQRLERAAARPVADPPDGRYFVDPVGLPVPLVNPGRTQQSVTTLATEADVPAPLRRRALFDELEGLRAGTVEHPRWFGTDPVVEVYADLGVGLHAVPVDEVTVADLSDPPVPPTAGWPRPASPLTVAVDPVLGRLAFPAGVVPAAVEVTATYAAPGRVGAGPYDRTSAATSDVVGRATWFRAVGARATPVSGVVTTTLGDAVTDWSAEAAGTVGVIAVVDNDSYAEDVAVTVPAGSELLVVAVTWPEVYDAGNPTVVVDLSQPTPSDRRPHLRGSLTVTGGPGADASTLPGELTVDGLLVEGDVAVAAGDLGRLALRHCTVVPGGGGVSVAPPGSPATDNGRLAVQLERSITGPVALPDAGPALTAVTSIIDGAGAAAVDAADCSVALDSATVMGALAARQLDASDCVLDGAVTVTRQQQGCVRFSYLTPGAVAPRRYRCQPDLALERVSDAAARAAVQARLIPELTSTTYGDPGYGRLDDRCDGALLTGASNGGAMGAFAELEEPQRMANLAAVLDEYLRLGLEAGVLHET